jgi:hypothetical protein
MVGGGGYYVERPPRLGFDGVAQPHAADAFLRAAALNRVLGDEAAASRLSRIAERIRTDFIAQFWLGDHFSEYIHPEHGRVDLHGLTDTDWAALAFGMATEEQQKALWPRLRARSDSIMAACRPASQLSPTNIRTGSSTTRIAWM